MICQRKQLSASNAYTLLRRLRFALTNIVVIYIALNQLQTAHAIFNCLPGMFPKMGKSNYMGLPNTGERANWYTQAQLGGYGLNAPYPTGYGQHPMKWVETCCLWSATYKQILIHFPIGSRFRFQQKWRNSLFGSKKWANSNFYRPGFGGGLMSMPSGYQFGDQLTQGPPFSSNLALPGANTYQNDGWSVPLNINPASLQQSQLTHYDNYGSQPYIQPSKLQGTTDSYGSTKGGSNSSKQQFGTTKK